MQNLYCGGNIMSKGKDLYVEDRDYEISEMNYKSYESLTSKEINDFIDMAILDDTVEAKDKVDMFLCLALYSYACGEKLPFKLYSYLLDNGVYYYGDIYLRANEHVAKKLIEVIKKQDDSSDQINHLLSALSAIPCEITKNFLIKNSEEPLPSWAKKLYILPIN